MRISRSATTSPPGPRGHKKAHSDEWAEGGLCDQAACLSVARMSLAMDSASFSQ